MDISYRVKFYNKCIEKCVKSLDYRIWARSFRDKGKNENLLKIKNLLRTVRKDPTKNLLANISD